MKMKLRPGMDSQMAGLFDQIQALEEPDSGLVRTMVMRGQNDPSVVYVLVVFDSEEHARAREQDPRRQEAMKSAQATMAEVFDGPPEFADLTVLKDVVP